MVGRYGISIFRVNIVVFLCNYNLCGTEYAVMKIIKAIRRRRTWHLIWVYTELRLRSRSVASDLGLHYLPRHVCSHNRSIDKCAKFQIWDVSRQYVHNFPREHGYSSEALLMSTHNTQFAWKNKKKISVLSGGKRDLSGVKNMSLSCQKKYYVNICNISSIVNNPSIWAAYAHPKTCR